VNLLLTDCDRGVDFLAQTLYSLVNNMLGKRGLYVATGPHRQAFFRNKNNAVRGKHR
jgi:hypothetical protein